MTDRDQEFRPLYAIPPGDTLEELLTERRMTQTELARRMGRPQKTINEIVQAKAAITPETAIQLERVLGVPASLWTNLERQYREDLARLREVKALENQTNWLERFPIGDLRKMGYLPKTRDRATLLHYVLRFFGVGSIAAWQNLWLQPTAAFRQSPVFAASNEANAAWLRAGAIEAEQIECSPYNRSAFSEFLTAARSLTREDPEDFNQPLLDGCRACGVAVVFLAPFKGVTAYGATHWIDSSKAIIQLSNRYKADDHLWFTFFHEAYHILKHGHRSVFVEPRDVAMSANDDKEAEANRFASDILIPPSDWIGFLKGHPSTTTGVVRFADNVGVSPGIVVGRLQHERIWPYTQGNGLKRRFDLSRTAS